jgi:hypothetical protein
MLPSESEGSLSSNPWLEITGAGQGVDATDLVVNEMFANAFLDADDRKSEQILMTLGEAQGTA